MLQQIFIFSVYSPLASSLSYLFIPVISLIVAIYTSIIVYLIFKMLNISSIKKVY